MIRRRLDKIEASLTPVEVIVSWIEEVNQFENVDAYVKFVLERGGAPMAALENQVRNGVVNRAKVMGNAPSPQLLRQCLREWRFYLWLVTNVNGEVENFCHSARLYSSAVSGIWGAVSEAVSYKTKIAEMFRLTVQERYGLDSSIAAAFVAARARHVTSLDDLNAHLERCVSVDPRAKDRRRACDELNAAVQKLCEEHRLNGFSVDLGVSPVAALRNAPLVDGQWVDQTAIELAEFAQLLRTKGIKIGPGEISHFARINPSAEGEMGAMRAEVAARLSRFPGRTKQINRRLYLHLDDYRTWDGRKAGGSLPVSRGVITWAWNNLVAGAEIAGIRVEMLGNGDDGTRFDRERHKLLTLHPTVGVLKAYVDLEGALQIAASFISSLLIDTRAMEIASERLGTEYLGRQILFKPVSKGLEELLERVRSQARVYNEIAEAAGDVAFGFEGWRLGKIDFSESDEAAQQKASEIVNEVVCSSKVKMLSEFGETDEALKAYGKWMKNRL